jgi:hypothetical protein
VFGSAGAGAGVLGGALQADGAGGEGGAGATGAEDNPVFAPHAANGF